MKKNKWILKKSILFILWWFFVLSITQWANIPGLTLIKSNIWNAIQYIKQSVFTSSGINSWTKLMDINASSWYIWINTWLLYDWNPLNQKVLSLDNSWYLIYSNIISSPNYYVNSIDFDSWTQVLTLNISWVWPITWSLEWIQWPQGEQGIQWPKWNTWDQGNTWAKWDTWEVWPQWIQWNTWATWPQGEQGIQWATWAKWDTWEQWPQWPQWNTWATGAQWIQGVTWAKWDTWATWLQGIQWPKWNTWATGIQGIQGVTWAKWDTWAMWATGAQGIQGVTWATWPQGEQGIQWPKWDTWSIWGIWPRWHTWDTWPQWPQGITGAQGATWPAGPSLDRYLTGISFDINTNLLTLYVSGATTLSTTIDSYRRLWQSNYIYNYNTGQKVLIWNQTWAEPETQVEIRNNSWYNLLLKNYSSDVGAVAWLWFWVQNQPWFKAGIIFQSIDSYGRGELILWLNNDTQTQQQSIIDWDAIMRLKHVWETGAVGILKSPEIQWVALDINDTMRLEPRSEVPFDCTEETLWSIFFIKKLYKDVWYAYPCFCGYLDPNSEAQEYEWLAMGRWDNVQCLAGI